MKLKKLISIGVAVFIGVSVVSYGVTRLIGNKKNNDDNVDTKVEETEDNNDTKDKDKTVREEMLEKKKNELIEKNKKPSNTTLECKECGTKINYTIEDNEYNIHGALCVDCYWDDVLDKMSKKDIEKLEKMHKEETKKTDTNKNTNTTNKKSDTKKTDNKSNTTKKSDTTTTNKSKLIGNCALCDKKLYENSRYGKYTGGKLVCIDCYNKLHGLDKPQKKCWRCGNRAIQYDVNDGQWLCGDCFEEKYEDPEPDSDRDPEPDESDYPPSVEEKNGSEQGANIPDDKDNKDNSNSTKTTEG